MTDELHTPAEWAEMEGFVILEADGWNEEGAPEFTARIPKSEYLKRIVACTVGPATFGGREEERKHFMTRAAARRLTDTAAPRPVDRIAPTLAAIEKLWREHPDLRLGQLIENLALIEGSDTFIIEDDRLQDAASFTYLYGWAR